MKVFSILFSHYTWFLGIVHKMNESKQMDEVCMRNMIFCMRVNPALAYQQIILKNHSNNELIKSITLDSFQLFITFLTTAFFCFIAMTCQLQGYYVVTLVRPNTIILSTVCILFGVDNLLSN